MAHTLDIVAEGSLIGETSYPDRSKKYTELELEDIKIDFYDAKNKVIHEVKKTDKEEQAHIAQVKYYLYMLSKNGIEGASALLEYPKMRQTQIVEWEEGDQSLVQGWVQEVKELISQENCPSLEKKSICRSCSYFDFCYATESTDNDLI
ncbi:Dna2/Cas4 domain-containing protein [Cyclobacterium roseum]|uniref:Dna2/Cas4 domain-containing protein n=1 Tax=Cyclobacterium roseum TaxID=2666137 RepID=UPI00192EB992|nr:Dna2/Cas4 domain-containing protein [Cyclobacterium roseum]